MCLENFKNFTNFFFLKQRVEFSIWLQHSLYSGHLNDPPHVGRVYFVLNKPLRQAVPLLWRTSVDGQTWLCMLVLTLLQVMGHFLLKVRKSV